MKSPFEVFAVRCVSSAIVLAAMVSACGGGEGGGDGPGPDDGSELEAGASDGSGGDNARGGSPGEGSGGTQPAGGRDAGSELDDSGKASLDGDDGITGVASGKLFARTMNLEVDQITPEYVLLEADDGADGNWTLRIPAKVGVFSCDSQVTADIASITLNDRGTDAIRGTTTTSLGGGCTLEVTSITGPIEGRFVAELVGLAGAINPVTNGYFHFTESPIGDCSDAEDPGVSDDELAATISITGIQTQGSSPFKCGTNAKLPAVSSIAGTNPAFAFRGAVGDRESDVRILGIRETGTFECGTDGVEFRIDSSWGGPNGGSCTIEVTEYGPDAVAGTYQASLWNGIMTGHATLDLEGSFRTKPVYP